MVFEKNCINQTSLLLASVLLYFWVELIGLRKDLIIMTIWSSQQEVYKEVELCLVENT